MKKIISLAFILGLSSSVLFAQNTLKSKTTKDKLFPTQGTTVANTASQKQQPATKSMPSFLNQGVDYSNSKPKKTETKAETKQQNVSADTTPNKDKTSYYSVERNQGSLYIRFTAQSPITAGDMFSKMRNVFVISQNDSIGFVKNDKDNIGYTHYQYQQFYKGIEVMGGQFLLHEKNSKLTSANGNFYPGINLPSSATITPQAAIDFAKNYMGAKKYMWEIPEEEQFLKREKNDINATYYPKPTLIIAAKNGDYNKENFRLCYRLTLSVTDPFVQIYDFYIDANTGELVNKITRINDGCFHPDKKKVIQVEKEETRNKEIDFKSIENCKEQVVFSVNIKNVDKSFSTTSDVSSTANTLYNGIRTITTDNFQGLYYLRETTRPIQTLNLKNKKGTTANYANAANFTNASTSWTTQDITLDSVNITSVSNNWQDLIGEGGAPDIYINIKDANSNIVWTNSGNYLNNTFTPITINTKKISLIPGSYTIEIYDYDAMSSDDLLGIFIFNTVAGIATGTSNGTSVNLYKSARNNPALDAHWGAEKVFDYYLTQFNRNSFDNAGTLIKSYVHSNEGANAHWNPYDQCMNYGDGDLINEGPQAALDVCGHELTHAVVDNNSHGGLSYQKESGALNESFADIFGAAVEFYATPSRANWLFSEQTFYNTNGFTRSLSNPKLKGQPNTYNGQYWQNPDCGIPDYTLNDYCGVHTNSGVQNYWFFLLTQGGSGTNDLGNVYSVNGIGLTDAAKIAYYNLTTQLNSNSTYYDSYQGSLNVAEAIFGNPSTQYSAVKNAWYAVGIGNNPITYCSGTTVITSPSGTITDGSGSANYNNNSDCRWRIAPSGADSIKITFTSLQTENNYDTLFVYDGPTTSFPYRWWTGNWTTPPTFTSSVGAVLIRFKSNNSITAAGWSLNYTTYGGTSTCNGNTLLANTSGTLNDGSAASNYGNNQTCVWHIAPPCATSLTLTFTQFATESGYDSVTIYDGSFTRLNSYSGTSIPPSITTNTGEFYIVFKSDYSINAQGWTANYSSNSTASGDCSGNKTTPSTTTLNTSDYGSITDGSGANNYCNNRDCRWLIQPPQATSVKLSFLSFDVEDASSDGNSIYDAVEIYDGATTSATLLGRYTGNTIPAEITSSTGSLLVRFFTDNSVEKTGWSAFYTSTSPSTCNSTTTLTTTTGTISDGSGANQYANNSDCSWLIQPANASKVTLCFSDFNTELNYDGVIIYDGPTINSTVLAVYTGTSLPASVTSTGGSMLVRFVSDEALRSNGWTATFSSTPSISANGLPIICQGSVLTLTSTSSSNNQWFLNGSPIPGATNATFSVTTSGNYTALTNIGSCASNQSNSLLVTVNSTPSAPTLTASGATTICQGSSVTLSSNAITGLTYQWKKDGVNITGATASSYLATVAGTYSLVVTNISNCSNTSNTVLVTVNSNPITPTITASGATTFCQGSNVTLNSNVITGVTYQWKKDGANISGATAASYTATVAGSYTVVVTNSSNCSSASNATIVTVNNLPSTPSVVASGATNFCQGGSVTLTSSSSNGNQWYNNGTLISGATGSTYSATATGVYTVTTTTGSCASLISNTVTITVNALPSSVITAAGPTSFCSGGNVVLNANTGTGLTYQWKKDGTDISGATSSSFTATVAGSYTLVVTNSSNCITTSNATIVTVNNIPTTPSVTATGNLSFCQGGSVTLTSSSSNGNQWYNNGTLISGSTGSTYTATGTGVYTVTTTTGSCTSPISNAISVTVNALPSSIITAAGPTAFCVGGSVVLNANTGTGLTYQWKKDGTDISGSTASNLTATVAGSYTVLVTNSSNCSSTSNATIVTIGSIPTTPSISWSGTQFSTTASGVSYQWFLNGNAIAGATSANYTPTSIGVYKVTVTANGCSNTSDNYTLVVTGIDPTLILSPFTAQVYPNPAKNDFAIKFGETPNVTLDIQLINNLGVVIKSVKTKSNLTTLKVNELPSGLYFIKIIGGAFNQVKKIEIIK